MAMDNKIMNINNFMEFLNMDKKLEKGNLKRKIEILT